MLFEIFVQCLMTTQQTYAINESHILYHPQTPQLFILFHASILPPMAPAGLREDYSCNSELPQRGRLDYMSWKKGILISSSLSEQHRLLSDHFSSVHLHFQAVQICASHVPKSSLPKCPEWPSLPEIWLELQSWLDGLCGIKNQAITERNKNEIFCLVWVVCWEGGGWIKPKLNCWLSRRVPERRHLLLECVNTAKLQRSW